MVERHDKHAVMYILIEGKQGPIKIFIGIDSGVAWFSSTATDDDGDDDADKNLENLSHKWRSLAISDTKKQFSGFLGVRHPLVSKA